MTEGAGTEPSRAPLDQAAVAEQLPAGWRLEVVAETGSTNADLLAAADRGAADRSLLVAELQTSGRGRLDRGWQSPTGAGLTVSVLLRPPVPPAGWGWLPLIAGLALSRSLGEQARLKWPNDLVMGPEQAKVAGILGETGTDVAVLGIGLNVSTTAAELPVPSASSLALQGYPTLDRGQLLVNLVRALDAELARWYAADGDATRVGLADDYRARCATLGSEVQVDLPGGGTERGRAEAVDDSGRLVVRPAGGEPMAVAAGDVTHIRAVEG
ncbi:MAG TPA: biotin--[acetyl-CoA-carboxylase] ligase [Jatrophihabitans sp.]|nr:biotin--[acetyl-CoA-carboxylase] ligase [Jatrophihabitans sp.]